MRDQGEKVFLLLEDFRFGAQRPADDGDAGRQRQHEECAFPRITVDAPVLFFEQLSIDLRGQRGDAAVDHDSRQQTLDLRRPGP